MELSISRESPPLNATKVRLPDSGGACQSNESTRQGMVDQELSEVDYESLPTDRLSAHLLAGGAAGIMEHCVMYPVDCVKVSSSYCYYLTPYPCFCKLNKFVAI